MIHLEMLDRAGLKWAQETVTKYHYLHRPVDTRTQAEGYAVHLSGINESIGLLLFGRPEATRCSSWYGGTDDVQAGRCEVTRWQVLNLSRVWLSPEVQTSGRFYSPEDIPGFTDRRGVFRSTLASEVIQAATHQIGHDYLIRRPPCFLDEPYQIEWLLSYCDTSKHKGTIYAAAGFELYRTNDRGIQTWRTRLPGLTFEQDARIREAARINPRSIRFRAQRAQLSLGF